MSFAPPAAASVEVDPRAVRAEADPRAVRAEAYPRAERAARFGWVMAAIDRLGLALTRRLSREVPEKGATADQCEAWLLVSRSVRWLHALQARLARGGGMEAAETAAARAEAPVDSKAADAKAAKAGDAKAPDAAGTREGKAKRKRLRTADDEIRGKPTEAVVARICADLGTAALLLGDAEAARRAAALAERARALLNGEPEPERRIDPRSPEFDLAARQPDAARRAPAMPARAPSAWVAPDTG